MAERRRFVILGAFAFLAATAVCAGAAWGCTSTALVSASAATAPAGAQIGLTGSGFDSAETSGPIEIRWNSLTGAPLASSTAGFSFSVVVEIPTTAKPGYYFISAIQRKLADNAVAWKVSVPVEVVDPAATEQAPSEPTGATQPLATTAAPADGQPAGVTQAASASQPADASEPADVTPPSGTRQPVATGTTTGSPTSADAGATAPPTALTGAAKAVLPTVVSRGAGAPTTGATSPVPLVSVPTAGPASADAGIPAVVAVLGAQPAPAPSNPAAAWVGTSAAHGPSLFEPVDSAHVRHGGGFPIALTLVGGGVMAIVAIGALAGPRRRLMRASSGGGGNSADPRT